MRRTPDGWIEAKLGDIAEEVTVGHVSSMASEYQESGVMFLRSQNIVPHGFDLSDVRHISPEFHARLRKSSLIAGDVVTVRTGKPGATAVIPDGWQAANCSDLIITRPGPNLDSRWLSYYINSVAAGFINNRLVGAVQQHFNVGAARDMDLCLPSMREQRAIAEVLGALDDKIAANRKMAATAEQLAVLAMANAGVTILANLVNHWRSTELPAVSDATRVEHFSLPAFDEGEMPETVDPAEIKSSKFKVQRPSVLISKLNPRFPRVWEIPVVPTIPAYASTEFLVLEPKYGSTATLWAALRQPSVARELESMVAGTSGSHQRVKPSEVLGVSVPDIRSVDDSTVATIDGLSAVIHSARRESRDLVTMRDALLPRLMSGELRVRDAERVVEDVL